MINNVVLSGILLDNPIESQTANQKSISRFTLIVHNKYNEKSSDFIDCLCWGDVAKEINENVKKGSFISVIGRLTSSLKMTQNEGKINAVVVWVKEFNYPKKKSNKKQQETIDNHNKELGLVQQEQVSTPNNAINQNSSNVDILNENVVENQEENDYIDIE